VSLFRSGPRSTSPDGRKEGPRGEVDPGPVTAVIGPPARMPPPPTAWPPLAALPPGTVLPPGIPDPPATPYPRAGGAGTADSSGPRRETAPDPSAPPDWPLTPGSVGVWSPPPQAGSAQPDPTGRPARAMAPVGRAPVASGRAAVLAGYRPAHRRGIEAGHDHRADRGHGDQGHDHPGYGDQGHGERVDRLVGRLSATDTAPVEVDEVAALLEATGITDQVATREYRQPGLFALAAVVLHRLPCAPAPHRHAIPRTRWDWPGLIRSPLLATRLVGVLGIALATWALGGSAGLIGLIGIPPAEIVAAWYLGQLGWALDTCPTWAALRRYRRLVGHCALAALVPPLLAAVALTSAGRVVPHATAGLVRGADGVLLAGGYALLLLLAAAGRPATVAVLAALGTGTAVLAGHPLTAGGTGLLCVGYLLALVVAAYVLVEPRGRP
jgi:hypothetical protein